ncbi:hypothetical protein EVAR_13361_1 [Eumeta japonica]|uniref:Uncharacterized protein n=1 Tax=Eumeta variegata TaxID=151549 RepID=A0A4C1TS63_EUMVA|nr:hypothetical protein EVAR_13361_1 [Eumeta japonica]
MKILSISAACPRTHWGVGVGGVARGVGVPVPPPGDLLATISMFEQQIKAEPMSFYSSHPHVHTGPTIMRTDSNHTLINQHHPQEDSKDSLIVQQQVQHQQDLLEQHQEQLQHQHEQDELSKMFL